MIELVKITPTNVWKVVKLTVNDSQSDFVATNTESILEAYANISVGNVALPFAVYDNDALIGFIMFGYGSLGSEEDDAVKVSANNYCVWRIMIDKNYQGKGYGNKVMQKALEYLHTFPCGKAKYCWLSYEKENIAAAKLYKKFGFTENGEYCDDEIVAVLEL